MGLTSGGGSGAPALHATQHENGGSDEVDATGLTGVGGGGSSSVVIGARVYRGSNQSIPDSTATLLSFTDETRDDDTIWTLSPNPTRLTIFTDGDYDCLAVVRWAGNTTGSRKIHWYKNGVLVSTGTYSPSPLATNFHQHYRITLAGLVATDYLEVKVEQSSGGALNALSGEFNTFALVRTGYDFPFTDTLAEGWELRPGFSEIDQVDNGDGSKGVLSMAEGFVDILAKGSESSGAYTAELTLDGDGGDVTLTAGGSVGSDVTLLADGNFVASITAGRHVLSGGFGVQFPQRAADPTSPLFENQTYYNTVSHVLRTYDGTTWHDLW